jgi:hypothetical protein
MSHHSAAPRPPAGAEFFATALIADGALREAVLGDLAEEHAHLVQTRSTPAADRWYWWQIIRSAVPLSVIATSRDGALAWLRLAGAVFASGALLATLVIATDTFLLAPVLSTTLPGWQMPVASFAFGLPCGIVAGYAAAVFGGRSPITPALVLGLGCTALAMMMLPSGASAAPFGYQVVVALIVLPSCLTGAIMRAHQLQRRDLAPRAPLA